MQRRLVAAFTTICLVLSLLGGMVFTGTAAITIPHAKDLKSEEYANYSLFLVSDHKDLETLAEVVNGGNSLEGITFQQTTNIDLEGDPFTPIGRFDDGKPFKGVYDGQKFTISNLYIDLPEQNGVGLFGYAYNTTLKNIGIESGSVAGKNRAGGIAGYADSCIIMNCYNKADISLTSGADGVGGIAGVARPRTLDDSPYIPAKIYGCFNLGTIRTVSIGGSGIVGWSGNGDAIELHGCYSGGTIVDSEVITGQTPYYDTICRNRSRVTGDFSDNYYLAGICDDKYNEHNAVKINALNPVQMAGILNQATGTDSRTFTVKDGQLAFSGKVGDVIGSVHQKVYRDGVLVENEPYYFINKYVIPTTYDGSAVLSAKYNGESCQPGDEISVAETDRIILYLDGEYPNVTEYETYPNSKSYTVSTAAELAAMGELINDGVTTFEGKTIYVTADLDFSEYQTWTPIGILTSAKGGNAGVGDIPFCGTLDGQYHHFKNINFDQIGLGKYQALFAYVEGGVLQNIILDEGTVNASATRPAALAALMRNGTMQNVENHVSVYSSDTSETQNIGIIAATKNVNIIGCINYGTMGTANTAQQDNASFSGCGYESTVTENCISVGPVNGRGVFPVSQRSTHENCYFLDDVFSETPVSGQQTLSRARLLSGEAAWILNTASGTHANSGLWANASYGPTLDPENALYRISYTVTDSYDQVVDAADAYVKLGGKFTYSEPDGYEIESVTQGGEAISENWAVSGDAELSIVLKNKSYSIEYVLNGGAFVQTPPDSYVHGKSQELPGNGAVAKPEYCLTGWCDNAELTGTVYTAVPADLAKDITYYAKWDLPIEIKTPEDLLNISKKLDGCYILKSDIDLSETDFEAIGTIMDPFTGFFNGNGYTISGLSIHSNQNYQGLFGVNEGVIQNVTLAQDCRIYGSAYVGGIAGKNNGEIIDCISHASVGYDTEADPVSYKILSQNVCQWGDNDYYSYGEKISEKTRRPGMLTRIHDANADILLFQEVSFTKTANQWQAPPWSDYFAEHLPSLIDGRQYEIFGNARSYKETPAEGVQIVYDANKFKVATDEKGNEIKGEFWLSDTPTKESKYSDANNYRMCTWMMLEDLNNGTRLALYDIHLDFNNPQIKGAGVVRDYINAQMAKYPQAIFVAAGDYNCNIDTEAYNRIKSTGLENSRLLHDPTSSDITTHDGTMSNTAPATGGKAIDHILVSKDAVNVTAYERLTQVYDLNGVEVGYNDSGALRPSDHYGVTATISPKFTTKNCYIGGITGENTGAVRSSTQAAGSTVSGNSYVGGIAGNNTGEIVDCVAATAVNGSSNSSRTYKIMSQNLCQWGGSNRLPGLIQRVKDYDPDIICYQEAKEANGWRAYAEEQLPEYTLLYKDRGDGETAPLAYRTSMFTVMESGFFWLSETPEVKSKGWDAACNRICTWAVLREKESGDLIAAYSVHLDHEGETAQIEGAKLIKSRVLAMLEKYPDIMCFVGGDFNVHEDHESYLAFTVDGFGDTRNLTENTSAYNTFKETSGGMGDLETDGRELDERIDFITTYKDTVKIQQFQVLWEAYNGLRPSDHNGLMTTFSGDPNYNVGGIVGKNTGVVQRAIAQGTVAGGHKTGVAMGNNKGTIEAVYATPNDSYATIGGGDAAVTTTLPDNKEQFVYELNRQLGVQAFTVENGVITTVSGRDVALPVCITINETEQVYAMPGTEYTVDTTGITDPCCTLNGVPLDGNTFVVPNEDCVVMIANYCEVHGHDYGNPVSVNPTYHRAVCSRDETHVLTENHNKVPNGSFAVSCVQDGYDLVVCTECDYTRKDNLVKAWGHTWSRWRKESSATEGVQAQYVRECSVCHETESRYQGDPGVILHAEVDEEGLVTLTAELQDNPGISAMSLRVDYDSTVLEKLPSTYAKGDALNLLGITINIDEEGFIAFAWMDVTKPVVDTSEGTLFTMQFKLLKSAQVDFLGTVDASVYEGDSTAPFTVYMQDFSQEMHLHKYVWESVPQNEICECGRVKSTGLVDVDGDGVLSPRDVTVIMRYAVKRESEIPYMNRKGADYNKDGKISLGDAVAILRALSA